MSRPARFAAVAGCLLAAVACLVGALAISGSGFAGPAPILLAGCGGCIAAAAALLRSGS